MASIYQSVGAIDVTPGSTGSWEDVDLTSHVGSDAGSIGLAVFEFHNTDSSNDYAYGVRKNGSTDDRVGDLGPLSHCMNFAGTDGGDIVEIQIENAAMKAYFVGYFLADAAVAFTNAVDKSTGTDDSWQNVDISADTGADTAAVAFFEAKNGDNFNRAVAVAHGDYDGSSLDSILIGTVRKNGLVGLATALNSSEVCQQYIGDVDTDLFLKGYVKSGYATAHTSFIDKTLGSSGAYEDVDLSGDVSAGAEAVLFISIDSDGFTRYQVAARPNGETYDIYADPSSESFWGVVGLDANRVFEGKVEDTAGHFYITASFVVSAATPAGTAVLTLGAFTMGAAGEMHYEAVGAAELQSASLATGGEHPYAGAASFAAAPYALAASGHMKPQATAAFAVEPASLAASGVQEIAGQAAFSLVPPALAANALLLPLGQGNFLLSTIELAALGERILPDVALPVLSLMRDTAERAEAAMSDAAVFSSATIEDALPVFSMMRTTAERASAVIADTAIAVEATMEGDTVAITSIIRSTAESASAAMGDDPVVVEAELE